jgi:hypothetical protein
MMYNYKDHDEIPSYMKDYLLSVIDADSIYHVPVEDINDYLNGLDDWEEEHYSSRPEYLNQVM